MRNLPIGWVEVNLPDSSDIIMGQSPPSDSYNDKGEGLPFYQGKSEFGNVFPKQVKYCNSPKKIAENGDILLSVRAPVGPTNICYEQSCIGRGLAALRHTDITSTRYLFYYLRNIEPWLLKQGTGSTFSAISKKDLEAIKIDIAPLQEQKRIVAKLEKLIAKVDQCKVRLEKIPSILKRFRQSVLAAACSGELTKDWRKEYNIEKSFNRDRLGNIVDSIQIGPFGSLLHKADYIKNAIPLINPTNISNGQITYSTNVTISKTKRSELVRYVLEKGDVILGRRGEMGRCAVINDEQAGWICGTGSLFIRPGFKIMSKYLQIILSSPQVIEYLETFSVGTTMTNLNQKIIANMEIELPLKKEQQEIVRQVESLFKIADQIEERYKKAKDYVNKLTQSILAKAFRGELVHQDPNDEPASKLLERIKAMKEDSKSESNKRKRSSKKKARN